MNDDDPMWAEFVPLWAGLRATSHSVLVAGGYGLWLKQQSLRQQGQSGNIIPIIIPLEDWRDAAPRATKDLDFVLGLDLLASKKAHKSAIQTLTECGYAVVPGNERWQFKKTLSPGKDLVVDLHSELPEENQPHLTTDKNVRVKHDPSLGDDGVHGRQNPEAAGASHHSTQLLIGGIAIDVPNPVTWSVMKLVAASDRRLRADDESRLKEHRDFHRNQARKHADDVGRIVAMTYRDEADRASSIVEVIRSKPSYGTALDICRRLFFPNDSWGAQILQQVWGEENAKTIRDQLGQWFR